MEIFLEDRKVKMKSGDWKKLVCLSVAIWMLLFGTSFAKPFKGATFDIDVPIKYKMTVYKETSEMAFFAVDKDGASVSVVVQPSPFFKEDRVWTHDEKFKLGNQFIQTVTQSIHNYSPRKLVSFYDAKVYFEGERTTYFYRWKYRAREPKEEYLEMMTYQYVDGEKLYTITLAAWEPDFSKREEEFTKIAESFQLSDNPAHVRTLPTRKENKEG